MAAMEVVVHLFCPKIYKLLRLMPAMGISEEFVASLLLEEDNHVNN